MNAPDPRLAPAPALVSQLAEVTSIDDPQGLGRIEIRLLAFDGPAEQNAPLWARLAVPFAGDGRGAYLVPDVGDEVLVTFVGGDPRLPVVIGALWSGATRVPETPGGERIDRWSLTGKAGTRIAIVEAAPGEETIQFTTPGGVSGQLSDGEGGKVEFRAGGTTVTIDSQGVTVETALKVKIEAGAQVEVSAAMVTVNAGMSRFNGVVQADTVITNTVIASAYTPGAGNIW